ncbi:TIGR00645 family protein [Elioraea sp.]|jgi:uncharacterized protein (TIGR00645 family)|uniref:TIGR00645 family protein n=1 Tax=Elioraea sp. TaxID=2185103 RepID=UPI003F7009E1
MTMLQKVIAQIILASRYILVVFYVGLAAALLVYAGQFLVKLGGLAASFPAADDNTFLIGLLQLIDKALVAGLVVMVMLSSYDNFVARLEDQESRHQIGWLSKLDPGNLKIKLASAIVAISSIHLLQVFMNTGSYTSSDILWKVVIHVVFIGSALSLGVLDRITDKAARQPAQAE